MTVLLIILGVASVVELLLWTPLLWRLRRVVACLLIVIEAPVSGLLFGAHFYVWAGLVLFFGLYRLINLLRILEQRMQPDYLFAVTRTTSYDLIGLQVVVLLAAALTHELKLAPSFWLLSLGLVQIVAGAILLLSTRRHVHTTKPPQLTEHYADKDLPSLSVAIPARNETADLEACLQSLVASDYPKLEVLVLDDCSQNKHTSEIIRGFAQAGVRFVGGKAPPAHWLAKNFAYEQLSQEASGSILLFCGVDTRFEPASLRRITEAMLSKHKHMVSLVPRNRLPRWWQLGSLLIQPSRYAWEFALPRRWLQRPPVLSTCWLIERTTLDSAGGFQAVSRSSSPESFFARYAAEHDDGYSFMVADEQMALHSAKSVGEQLATAARTRYLQLHRRPELTAVQTLVQLGILIGPFGLAIGSLLSQQWGVAVLAMIAALLVTACHVLIVRLTYRRFIWRSLLLLPFAATYDIGLLHYSLWQYEFREVIWKGRNVCIPVMRTIPSLPKLPAKP